MFEKLSQLWRRLLFYLRRGQFDRELEEEMLDYRCQMSVKKPLASFATDI